MTNLVGKICNMNGRILVISGEKNYHRSCIVTSFKSKQMKFARRNDEFSGKGLQYEWKNTCNKWGKKLPSLLHRDVIQKQTDEIRSEE